METAFVSVGVFLGVMLTVMLVTFIHWKLSDKNTRAIKSHRFFDIISLVDANTWEELEELSKDEMFHQEPSMRIVGAYLGNEYLSIVVRVNAVCDAHAGRVVKEICEYYGGNGGGRPNVARGVIPIDGILKELEE